MRQRNGSFQDFLLRPVAILNCLLEIILYGHRYISFGFDGIKPVAKVQTHTEHIRSLQKELDGRTFQKKTMELEVERTLGECRHCDFIIFLSGLSFVQFGLVTGEYILDYPILPGNKLGKYRYQVLGLLAESGFVKSDRNVEEFRLLGLYYSPQIRFILGEESDGSEVIQANFRQDARLAAHFTSVVFSKFFQTRPGEIEVRVG